MIALATLLGITIDWSPLDPIKALFWSAVVDGVVAVPIMLANAGGLAPPHGGRFTASPRLLFFGWIAMAVMAVTAAAMLLVR